MEKTKMFRGRKFEVLRKKDFVKIIKGAKFLNDNELQEDSPNRNSEAFRIKLDVHHKFLASLEKDYVYFKKQLIGLYYGLYNDTYPSARINLETAKRYLGVEMRFLYNNSQLGVKLLIGNKKKRMPYNPNHNLTDYHIMFVLKKYVMIVDTEQKDLSNLEYKEIEKEQYNDLIQSLREGINKISEKLDKLEEVQKNESKN